MTHPMAPSFQPLSAEDAIGKMWACRKIVWDSGQTGCLEKQACRIYCSVSSSSAGVQSLFTAQACDGGEAGGPDNPCYLKSSLCRNLGFGTGQAGSAAA